VIIKYRPAHALARGAAAVALAATVVASLSACAPLIVGGAFVGSGMIVADRRTTGAQIEDQSIEIKAASRARSLATLGQIEVTSYNRTVLITGNVPAAEEKARVEQAVAAVENVRSVVNELEVGPTAALATRSNDAFIGAKIKATMVDAKDVHAGAYKVVVERGVVFLMGRVTEREAARGAELAAAVPGVKKVVRVFEILSEQDLATLGKPPLPSPAASAAQ
jgi:osmotically-inducible protein OsmY